MLRGERRRQRGANGQTGRASMSLNENEVDALLFMSETFGAKCSRMMPARGADFVKVHRKLESMRDSIQAAQAAKRSVEGEDAQ